MKHYNQILFEQDPAVGDILRAELARQQDTLVMIASENYASEAVLAAMGSIFTNKYAEGLPGQRYYNGCLQMDRIEQLCLDRARELFGAEYINVQPHSGSQANGAVFHALLKPGDTVLSLRLNHGGHLTHGLKLNYSGRHYRFIHYGLSRETERIDMDEVRQLAEEHRPRLIIYGGSAYPRHFDDVAWRDLADAVGALLMCDAAHVIGLIAGGVHSDPIPTGDVVTFTTHKTLRGPRGGLIVARPEYAAAINRAVFPGHQGGPFMHGIVGKAIALKEAQQSDFQDCQQRTVQNARALGEVLQRRGFRLVSEGTDNHLLLVDLTSQGWTGQAAANALEEVGICVNKNLIPYDPRPAILTSGIRIGTPAISTRGVTPDEAREIGGWIAEVLEQPEQTGPPPRIRQKVQALCQAHPIYPDYLDAA